MSSNSISAKSKMRLDLHQQLKNQFPQQRVERSQAIEKNLASFFVNQSGCWGAFLHLADEPQINWKLVSDRIKWCFPKITQNKLIFIHGAIHFHRSDLGVQEPTDGTTVELDQLAGVVAPGLAFSRSGHRLGRGQGYYDRNLFNYKGLKIGVCYGLSFVDGLPFEPHDVLFDHIVTETSTYQVVHSEGDLKWN